MLAIIRYTVFCLKVCFSNNVNIETYRNIILSVVVYGHETWSLTLREERRLRVFKNRVLKRVFGPKMNEATGEKRELNNEELIDLYCSPNFVRLFKSRKTEHLESPGLDGSIIIRWIFRK